MQKLVLALLQKRNILSNELLLQARGNKIEMRSISTAKRELKLMRQILDEFLLDYEQAQSEEDMSVAVHKEYVQKISEAYWKCKDLENRISGFAN